MMSLCRSHKPAHPIRPVSGWPACRDRTRETAARPGRPVPHSVPGRVALHTAALRRATVRNMDNTERTPAPLPPGAPVLYTVAETCAILRIARSTLWRLDKEGKVYSVRVAGAPRYPRESIDAYLRGEVYSPHGVDEHGQADVSTWPPTPSLLATGDTP